LLFENWLPQPGPRSACAPPPTHTDTVGAIYVFVIRYSFYHSELSCLSNARKSGSPVGVCTTAMRNGHAYCRPHLCVHSIFIYHSRFGCLWICILSLQTRLPEQGQEERQPRQRVHHRHEERPVELELQVRFGHAPTHHLDGRRRRGHSALLVHLGRPDKSKRTFSGVQYLWEVFVWGFGVLFSSCVCVCRCRCRGCCFLSVCVCNLLILLPGEARQKQANPHLEPVDSEAWPRPMVNSHHRA